jgi:peptidoglycan/xylan/chitin deacetylase (PgdA/CDA1 family)
MLMRRLIPGFLMATLLLTACSAAPSQNPGGAVPPETEQPAPSQPGGAAEPGGEAEPGGAIEPGEATNPDQPVTSPEAPAVLWQPQGIGYPLVPSDPAVETKGVLLTYDDGPSQYTAQLLDTLKEKGVKATFFITGYGAAQYPEMLERIHEEGHTLAVHTTSHANMTGLSREEMLADIQPLVDLIEEVTGEKPRYYRPPHGAYNDTLLSVAEELGLELMTWSLGSLDWEGVVDGYKDPQQVLADVDAQLHSGAVTLFHDTLKHTLEATPLIIDHLRAQGYDFITLP